MKLPKTPEAKKQLLALLTILLGGTAAVLMTKYFIWLWCIIP